MNERIFQKFIEHTVAFPPAMRAARRRTMTQKPACLWSEHKWRVKDGKFLFSNILYYLIAQYLSYRCLLCCILQVFY